MKLPDYDTCVILEKRSQDLWLRNLRENPNIFKVEWINDDDIQYKDHWDIYSIFRGKYPPLTIDTKIRSEYSYHTYYKNDNKIFIEVIGNVEKYEKDKNDLGSSIYNSHSNVWGYGWLVNEILTEPFYFYRKQFAEWLKPIEDKFPIKDAPSNNKITRGRLIPRYLFKPFEVPHLNLEVSNNAK